MGELIFIGLGLYDEKDLTLRAVEEARKCDILFAEFYTSVLQGTTLDRLKDILGKDLLVLTREDVEKGEMLLREAKSKRVGFLVAGDPMTATTHVDLRLRAAKHGITTRVIHGVSILTAAAGLLGLQAYKFGRTVTIPFQEERFKPTSPYEMISQNHQAGLHTLILLDLKEGGKYMTANEGMSYLCGQEDSMRFGTFTQESLVCVLGRVGSANPLVQAGLVRDLVQRDFGDPLHCIVLPGKLHFVEKEALVLLAGAPQDS
jgi:diphthine synthase